MTMSELQPQKAVIYCRVSSERQKNEGHGLDTQALRCSQHADSKGYLVDSVFSDSFTGGGDFMRRPAMVELLAFLDSKPHESYVVIFDDLSRLARDVVAHINLRKAFRARGATVECPNFNFEDTDESELVELVLAAQSQYHRKSNRRQVIQKQRARLEAGYWPFYPPTGYRAIKDSIHGKLLHPIEPMAGVIKEALEGFASGRFVSQTDVQSFLQSKDFASGKRVYLEVVKRLLTRIVYAGYIDYPRWEVSLRKGHHEPLISLETFRRIQDKLLGKARFRAHKGMSQDFPLRGAVVCSECNHPLTANWSTGRKIKVPYYRFTGHECAWKNKSVRRDKIEGDFESILRKVAPRKEIIEYTKALFMEAWSRRMQIVSTATQQKEAGLASYQHEKSRLIELITRSSSEGVVVAYEARLNELATKESALLEKIREAKLKGQDFGTAMNAVVDLIGNPYAKWRNDNIEDKKLVLKLVFTDKLRYSRDNGFGTADYSLPIKVFEQLSTNNSQGVEMWGIEPQSTTMTDTTYYQCIRFGCSPARREPAR